MNKQTISLGRVFGIPILVDFSWFLIFAFLTWNLAVGYFPYELSARSPVIYWVMGAATALLLFVSVVLHELGHSVVALQYKIPVRKITLFIFGGVAELGAEMPSATAEFVIAIAGPIVSFALAALFAVMQVALAGIAPVFVLAKYLALINGSLALFNLIPGFPLDGGRVFRALVWGITHNFRRATWLAANIGRIIAFLFIAFGIWNIFTGDLSGLWFAFVGWYLASAATSQLREQEIQQLLAGHPVSEAMNRSYVLIPAQMPLAYLASQNLLAYWQRGFVRKDDGTIVGLLTWRDIRGIPREKWETTTAEQAMVPVARLPHVTPETELGTVAGQMGFDGGLSLPVVSNGQILGTISREDLWGFLQRMQPNNA